MINTIKTFSSIHSHPHNDKMTDASKPQMAGLNQTFAKNNIMLFISMYTNLI
jgi:hypothetical protein